MGVRGSQGQIDKRHLQASVPLPPRFDPARSDPRLSEPLCTLTIEIRDDQRVLKPSQVDRDVQHAWPWRVPDASKLNKIAGVPDPIRYVLASAARSYLQTSSRLPCPHPTQPVRLFREMHSCPAGRRANHQLPATSTHRPGSHGLQTGV
jgi:hypothetical protein